MQNQVKKKNVLIIFAVAVVVVAALAIFFSGKQTRFTTANPDGRFTVTNPNNELIAPTSIEIPASEYQQMLNSGLFVQAHCFDGRVGIERTMVRPFKDPCFVSK